MNSIEKELLATEVGEQSPRLSIRSRTPVDTGRWWLNSRLWLHVFDNELVVMAAKRRRYIRRVHLDACSESHYCHNSGALFLAPTEDIEFNQIAMPASDAIKVLRILGIEP